MLACREESVSAVPLARDGRAAADPRSFRAARRPSPRRRPALDLISEIDAVVVARRRATSCGSSSPGRAASALRPRRSSTTPWGTPEPGCGSHGLAPDRPLATIHGSYRGFVELLTALTEYLGASLGKRSHLNGSRRGRERLPRPSSPSRARSAFTSTATGSRTFSSARNARVTAIDTLAPIREVRLYEVLRLLERCSGRFARNCGDPARPRVEAGRRQQVPPPNARRPPRRAREQLTGRPLSLWPARLAFAVRAYDAYGAVCAQASCAAMPSSRRVPGAQPSSDRIRLVSAAVRRTSPGIEGS
jgi:hypothetical protein